MANQIYENWWMNTSESEGGIYYRDRWYSDEAALNDAGYYIVYARTLYLGENHQEYKYQKVFYLISNNYYTYQQAHALGYSEYRSYTRHYINTNSFTYVSGYYNSYDGYFVEGVWYVTLQDLNNAGYEVGMERTYLYGIHEFKKFDSIVKDYNNIKYYYTTDSTDWFSEDEFEINDKSFMPSVETNWTLGTYWTNNYGHGSHSYSNNVNYLYPYRNGVEQTQSLLNSLVGQKPNNVEYDIVGAAMTDSQNWKNGALVGHLLYFEYCYQSSTHRGVICSAYVSSTSGFSSDQNYSTIAVALSKDVKLVKIYDVANFAYNAFNYTYNDVSYYYILDNDNTHDKWITDISSEGYSFTPYEGIRQINAVYGDEIKVPIGYDLVRAVGNCVNLFPSYVGIEDGTGYLVVAYEGKDWCNPRINPRMIRQYKNIEKGHPVFRIEQIGSIREDLIPHGQYTNTTAGTDNRNGYLELVDVKVKGTDPVYGDYYILLKSTSTSYKSYFENGLPARCWQCIGDGWYIHEYIFYEPPDTYSFNKLTATFTWTGDPSDTSDHAYWQYTDYHGASSGDHVYKFFFYAENEEDRIKNVTIYDIVNGSTRIIEYWPHDGYLYNSVHYTEQQLNNIGYSLTDIHNDYEWESVTSLKLSTEQTLTIYYSSNIGYVIKDVGTFVNEIELNNAGYIINPVYDISQVRLYFDSSDLNADTYKTRLSTNWATINDTQYVRRLYLDSALTEPAVYESDKLYYYNDSLSSMDAPGYHINNIAKFPNYTVTDNNQKTSLVNIISEHGTPNMPLVASDEGGGLWVYDCNNKEGTNTVIIPTFYADCYRTPYEGSETFYYLENEYSINYITTVNHSRYYRSPIGGFFTEQELLSKGYTRTPSSTVLCSDTNIEFNIDDIYSVMYNSQHGYYVNSHWYSTVQLLNNAGYYLVEKVSKTIYLTNSIGYFAYNVGVIKTTTSFDTSYKKPYYLDENRTQPFLWDGHKWFCDTAAQYNDTYTWRNKLRDMPDSTTGDYIRLLTMITASGNPITPYVQSEINTQMYLHLATSYPNYLSTDGNIVSYLIIAYWKLT